MSPSPSPLMARPAPRPSPLEDSAARGGRLHDHLLHDHLLRDQLLRDHLIRDHGRTGREIDGLPLADLHHFEHVEQAMGLNDVSHHHPAAPGGVR
jgi:hypothetical protein